MTTQTTQFCKNIEITTSLDCGAILKKMGALGGFCGKNTSQSPWPNRLLRPKQTHGTKLIEVRPGSADLSDGFDGIYTTSNNLPIGIVTADCVPVLLATKEAVMAIHAGWRGLALGILQIGATKISLLSANYLPQRAVAIIGPCASPQRYEVGDEVVDSMRDTTGANLTDEELAYCLTRSENSRWYLDLAMASAFCLGKAGLNAHDIFLVRRCTITEADQFYSYRRSKAYEGNNLSWIARGLT